MLRKKTNGYSKNKRIKQEDEASRKTEEEKVKGP